MKINVYSVYDSKAAVFNPPFHIVNDMVAIRHFETLVNDSRSTVFGHSEDYTLHQVGVFDDELGRMEGVPTPRIVCVGSQLVKAKPIVMPDVVRNAIKVCMDRSASEHCDLDEVEVVAKYFGFPIPEEAK